VARVPSSGHLHRYFGDRLVLARVLRAELKRARQEGDRPRLVAGWRRWKSYIVARGASSVALRVELSAWILAVVLLWTFLPMALQAVVLVALALLTMGIWHEQLAGWVRRLSVRAPVPPSAVWNQATREAGTPIANASQSDSDASRTGREAAPSTQHRAEERARADRLKTEFQARRRERRDRAETLANQKPGEAPTPPLPPSAAREPGTTQAAATGHRRGREKLLSNTGDARVLDLGPVNVGRELLMAGAAEGSGTECRLLLELAADALEAGARNPDPSEYPFGRPGEAEADALMWAGIARGLLGDADRASTHLKSAFDRWQRIGDPIKSGRCAEELAELLRLSDRDGGDEWFSRAETCFRAGSRDDRVAAVAQSRQGSLRHPSAFLLRRPADPQSSTILGSSTTVEIRGRLLAPPPRDALAPSRRQEPHVARVTVYHLTPPRWLPLIEAEGLRTRADLSELVGPPGELDQAAPGTYAHGERITGWLSLDHARTTTDAFGGGLVSYMVDPKKTLAAPASARAELEPAAYWDSCEPLQVWLDRGDAPDDLEVHRNLPVPAQYVAVHAPLLSDYELGDYAPLVAAVADEDRLSAKALMHLAIIASDADFDAPAFLAACALAWRDEPDPDWLVHELIETDPDNVASAALAEHYSAAPEAVQALRSALDETREWADQNGVDHGPGLFARTALVLDELTTSRIPQDEHPPSHRSFDESEHKGAEPNTRHDDIPFREFPPSHLPQIRERNPFLQWPSRFDSIDDESGSTSMVIDLRSSEPVKERHARELVRKVQAGQQVWLIGNPMVTSAGGEDGIVFWAVLELRCPDPGTVAVEIPIALGTMGVGIVAAIKRNPNVVFVLPGDFALRTRLEQWSPGLDKTAAKMRLQAEDMLLDLQGETFRGVDP
jgi:hypothetical protein